jgi:hypothetical protein
MSFLIKMLDLFHSNHIPERVRPAHVVDVSTPEGLLALMSVGCLMELAPALDDRHYSRNHTPISEEELDEIDATAACFRLFLRWYGEQFLVVFENKKWVNAAYLFKRRLVDFACTVFWYIQEQQNDSPKLVASRNTLSDVSFAKRVISHFSLNWSDLVDRFQESRHTASPWLYYTGPQFKLVSKVNDRFSQFVALYGDESCDYQAWPLAVKFKRHLDPPASSSLEDTPALDDLKGRPASSVPEDCAASSGKSSPLAPLTRSPSLTDEHMDTTTDRPQTPPPAKTLKRDRGSSGSSPNKTPSSSRPAKRSRPHRGAR